MSEISHSQPEQPMKPAIDINELKMDQTKTPEDESRVNYRILTGYKRAEGDEQLRTRYLRYTGELIREIADRDIDVVVYLDKSARPVEWMVREFWDYYMPDKPRPEAKFVNIDREDWRPSLGSPEYGDYRPDDLDISAKQELRDIFADLTEGGKSLFDGKNVLIVDEVKVSGDTLQIAEDIFRQAFPAAKVEGAWWMIPSVPLDNGSVDVPVWYRKDTAKGRGIENKSADVALASVSARQRAGVSFLSNRPETPDTEAIQLRAEIKQLRRDVEAGNQRVIPLN